MESGDFLFEESNFNPRTTGLPNGIILWVRTEVSGHGHNRYRVKISKNNKWTGIFTISESPTIIKDIDGQLSDNEQAQIYAFIRRFKTLLVSLVDGRIDSGEFTLEVKKARGEDNG